MHNLRRFALFVVLLVALLLPLSLFAATGGFTDFHGFFFAGGPDPDLCDSYAMGFEVTFTGTTVDITFEGSPPGAPPDGDYDMVSLLFFDANGVRLQNAGGGLTIEMFAMIGENVVQAHSAHLVGITARPVTVALFDPGPEVPGMHFADQAAFAQYIEDNATLLDTIVHDPLVQPTDAGVACAGLPLLAPYIPQSGGGGGGDDGGPVGLVSGFGDNRLANVPVDIAIYVSANGIMVYGVNNDSVGFMGAYVSAADLPAEPPAQNTLLAQSSDGYYSIYMLSTGEYQVNVGPTPDGWVRVMIFSSLSPNAAVTRADFHVSSVTP